jgi:hypothetical protein
MSRECAVIAHVGKDLKRVVGRAARIRGVGESAFVRDLLLQYFEMAEQKTVWKRPAVVVRRRLFPMEVPFR